MRECDLLVIHCSDSPNGKHFTVEDIDDWHQEKGFLRQDSYRQGLNPTLAHIGYHAVIYVDGSVHSGRQEAEVGAHAEGYNSRSLGICLIGRDKYNALQWDSLEKWLRVKLSEYPKARIKGHYQIDAHGKTCPNFDVPAYVARGFIPDTDDILS